MSSVVDNDILYKAAWFAVTEEVLAVLGRLPGDTCVLGQARFVVKKKIEKQTKTRAGAVAASERFSKMLAAVTAIEPTREEISIAAQLENSAREANAEFDPGESLLCAVLHCRGLDLLATGDKRAVSAMPSLADPSGVLLTLRGRIVCLEQLLLAIVEGGEAARVRGSICSEAHADRALSACFSCSSSEIEPDQWKMGLSSYIESLRRAAPGLLAQGIGTPINPSVGVGARPKDG